jgi:hypothetical protein
MSRILCLIGIHQRPLTPFGLQMSRCERCGWVTLDRDGYTGEPLKRRGR